MAAPIRPPVWPLAPSTIHPGRADTRLTAQKAFFEAALAGKTEPVAQAIASHEPRAAPAQAARAAAETEARALDRLPPPGSILDILV
jgi:hypothetical protein